MRHGRHGGKSVSKASEFIEFARFAVSFEGEVAAARLHSEGLRAVLFSADAEGWAPHFNLVQGARLLVHPDDIERARRVLGTDHG